MSPTTVLFLDTRDIEALFYISGFKWPCLKNSWFGRSLNPQENAVSEIGVFVPSMNDFNIITVGHVKRMRTFEQPILRIRFFVKPEDVSTIRLCPFYLCLRVATLCDSIYTGKSMIMQRVIFRSLPIFQVLNSGHFIWTTLNWVSCFLVFPRSRLKRQSQCVSFASWSRHVSLSVFRGISCFVIFNVTRAILETLLSHLHLVALWSQRAAVKSRHTQQRFFSLVQKTP